MKACLCDARNKSKTHVVVIGAQCWALTQMRDDDTRGDLGELAEGLVDEDERDEDGEDLLGEA